MTDRLGVTGGQLAQAAGCDPSNPCYFDCCRAWRETLEEWDNLSPREQWNILQLVDWIDQQVWV